MNEDSIEAKWATPQRTPEPSIEKEDLHVGVKLFISLIWLSLAAVWVCLVTMAMHLSNWGDGASHSITTGWDTTKLSIFRALPAIALTLASLSLYRWFPRRVLRFACWPFSLLSVPTAFLIAFGTLLFL